MAIVISGTTGISANAAQFLIGQVVFMAGANAPSGLLKCNGQLVSRTKYASLFAVIGTTYGAGDGSTTFNVPDLRGEFIRGLDDGRGIDPGRGIGTSQASQNLAHIHAANGWSATTTASVYDGGIDGSYNSGGADRNYVDGPVTASSGGNEARPRNVALLAYIFTGV